MRKWKREKVGGRSWMVGQGRTHKGSAGTGGGVKRMQVGRWRESVHASEREQPSGQMTRLPEEPR